MKTVFTKDGVEVEKGTNKYKGHIFYDEDGGKYKCLGYFPKLDDCVYENLQTGKEVVGCMDGFYFKDPTEKYAKGTTIKGLGDFSVWEIVKGNPKKLYTGSEMGVKKFAKKYNSTMPKDGRGLETWDAKATEEQVAKHHKSSYGTATSQQYAKGSTVEGGRGVIVKYDKNSKMWCVTESNGEPIEEYVNKHNAIALAESLNNKYADGGGVGEADMETFIVDVHSELGEDSYTIEATDGVQAFQEARYLFKKENPEYKGQIDLSMRDKYANGGNTTSGFNYTIGGL